jgi:Domain of unknown function (DUF4337)
MLAICGMGGGNAAKDSTRANIEAANIWNFFQAKNLRRQAIRLQNSDLELQMITNSSLTAEGKAAIEKRIADNKAVEKLLTTDPERKEGLDELFEKAKGLEKERDVALRKDPYFDWAQALLQISIVLATVCLVTYTPWLLVMSFGVGVLGTLMMLNGFTLAFAIPGLG